MENENFVETLMGLVKRYTENIKNDRDEIKDELRTQILKQSEQIEILDSKVKSLQFEIKTLEDEQNNMKININNFHIFMDNEKKKKKKFWEFGSD